MEPLRVSANATGSEGTWLWIGRVPGLRAVVRQRRFRRRRRQIIESVNGQLSKRVVVRERWRDEPEVAAAAEALCGAIQRATGIGCQRVIGDDPVDALLVDSIDQLEGVEVLFELERWLGAPIDPGFFNQSFCRMTVRHASGWLAGHRKGGQSAGRK